MIWEVNPNLVNPGWVYIGCRVVLVFQIEDLSYDADAEVTFVDGDTITVVVLVVGGGTPPGAPADEFPEVLADDHPVVNAMIGKSFTLTKTHVFFVN